MQILGAIKKNNKISFSIYYKDGPSLFLNLFDYEKKTLFKEILLEKTGLIWHTEVSDLPDKFHYAFRKENSPGFIIDPYARHLCHDKKWGQAQENSFSTFISEKTFDWEDDTPLNLPLHDLIIYEMHVRGFTQHHKSSVKNQGTFLGVSEKIPYLKELGINAVEFLPIFAFNECEYTKTNPQTGEQLYNYWGYMPVSFFSPMEKYGSPTEFKHMVKELHKNGIEVILDVVYNHTNNDKDPLPYLSFHELSHSDYYMPSDYTGCGNTFNANNPIGADIILDSLKYWISEMHVDGFRFDLASCLTRDQNGNPSVNPPVIERISSDPILANTKLIAEPWDAVGLYQVGTFPHGQRWSEWNDQYRDVIRRFIKGNSIEKSTFSTRISGSQDIYYKRSPLHSINFITAHDGFCLTDLVSYNDKHNTANGEKNRDGMNNNESWNCGFEGPTDKTTVKTVRERQKRNFVVALMISQGVPMVCMGDEYGHTRHGNNNPWCQDNDLNWFLWDQYNNDFFRFVKEMIQFRKTHPFFKKDKFLTHQDVKWYNEHADHMDWNSTNGFIAFTLGDLYIAFNAQSIPISTKLPSSTCWKRIVDTKLPSPHDFKPKGKTIQVAKYYYMAPFSSIILTKKEPVT
jgi:isoamylase